MNSLLERFGGPRVAALLVGVGAVAAIWAFGRWGAATPWVPVVSGVPMERIGRATQRLDESGIEYRLDRGGSVISVRETAAARARVVLAAEGFAGSATRPGFELFDQPSWGMTDFTQRVNYRRALEGELERTISRMRGIRGAQVHLALQEQSWIRSGARPNEASVVLQLDADGRAGDSMVEGIQFLVANAVEGLVPENVTVLDDRGRLLSAAADEGGVGLSHRQLQVQRQVEGYLQAKAEALVEQIVGAGNVTVRVAAELNFDRIDRTVQDVDPDQQVLVSEDRSEIVPGAVEQGAGSVSSKTVYETARSVETLSRGGARLERLSVAVVVADRRTVGADGQEVFQARDARELQRVEAVVKNAVGFNAERGDAISVVSAPTESAPPPVPEDGAADVVVSLVQSAQRPAVALFGLGVTLYLALRILSAVRAPAGQEAPTAAGTGALAGGENPREIASGKGATPLAGAGRPPLPQVADPQLTARVLRAWMKE